MENASKALIMAAGVLISMIIISLAVYLFLSFGSSSAQLHQEQEEQRLNQFNTQFTSYVGLQNITIYDVVTVANLATENNIYYGFPKKTNDGKDNYISVYYISSYIEGGIGGSQTDYNKMISDELKNGNSDLPLYNCQVEISPTTQRVYKVVFSEKSN